MGTTQVNPHSHPYQQFVGTKQWSALDHALEELIENHDLEERTGREYIVGFLCQALAEKEKPLAEAEDERKLAHMRAALKKAQEMLRAADPNGASMADELIAERRLEAARE
jgi:hypothetical protein